MQVIEYLVRRWFVVIIVGRELSRERLEWGGVTCGHKSEGSEYRSFVEETFVSREVGVFGYSINDAYDNPYYGGAIADGREVATMWLTAVLTSSGICVLVTRAR